jgi:hypothetical protein
MIALEKRHSLFFPAMMLLLFFLSGCSLPVDLGELDKTAGDILFSSSTPDKAVSAPATEITSYKDLSDKQKIEIDDWLKANGYNRYGDSAGVMYAGGTPLFDEASGTTMDRYEYILKNHPDILSKIKSASGI